ncbi:MAG: hypothetical protein ACYCXH_02075, partial [Bellilinea sp.]
LIDYPSNAKSWKSDRDTLLTIIDIAEDLAIDPNIIAKLSISHLREIRSIVAKAAMERNKEELEGMFDLAGDKTITDLRVDRKGLKRESIRAKKEIIAGNEYFVVYMTEKQFNNIQETVRRKYELKLDTSY